MVITKSLGSSQKDEIINEIEETIHMADLEKAIHYMVETEIVAQETLDELKLKSVYQMLESVIRYLPLRKPMRRFLMTLGDWPGQMEFKTLKGLDYKDKVSRSYD